MGNAEHAGRPEVDHVGRRERVQRVQQDDREGLGGKGVLGVVAMRRDRRAGLMLIELIVAFTILAVLSVLMLPVAKLKIRMERERDLRIAETQMRAAIDKYKDYCDAGYFGPPKLGSDCY